MRASRRLRIHPVALGAWLAFLAALVVVPRIMPGEATVRDLLVGLGPYGPAVFVLAEALQVIVIPIPGQPIEIPGGYLFGLGAGIVLASAGALAGSVLAFGIGRRYGRRWVEHRVSPEVRDRFDAWLSRGHRAERAVFWLMLVPAFPRDPLCYLAGLTRLTAVRFAAIAAIGRPVGLIPWVALGADGVEVGLKLQLWLFAGVAGVWLARLLAIRVARVAARRRRPTEAISPSIGERDA